MMRVSILPLVLMLIANPLRLSSQGVEQFASDLLTLPQYTGHAHFEVLLPNAEDPVIYEIDLQSEAAPSDSLFPCKYAISWQAEGPNGTIEGFSAYFDGNHYRFRNNRLQEYHMAESESPFMPNGPGSAMQAGVQSTAQFADLLPQTIGYKIKTMAADTTCVVRMHADTLINGKKRIAIDGARMRSGYELSRFLYVFDKETLMPVSIALENSPGSISEQLVDVCYGASAAPMIQEFTEEAIAGHWPEVFERFRESTFRAESLKGKKLPAFASQQLGSSERYAHHADEQLGDPTLVVVLNPEVASTAATIAAIRDAMAMSPAAVSVIFAFSGNDTQAVEQLIGDADPAETVLISASDLIRNCGVAAFPTIFFVGSNGTIEDVMTGVNNDLSEIVIQKTALLR